MAEFCSILRQLKEGHHARRDAWPDGGWILLDTDNIGGRFFTYVLDLPGGGQEIDVWHVDGEDLLATDWKVIHVVKQHDHRFGYSPGRRGRAMCCRVRGCKEPLVPRPGARISDGELRCWQLGVDGLWFEEEHEGHLATWAYLASECGELDLVAQGGR